MYLVLALLNMYVQMLHFSCRPIFKAEEDDAFGKKRGGTLLFNPN